MNRVLALSVAGGLLSLTLPGGGAGAQETDRSFQWNGTVASGNWVRIRNLNGGIRVERSSGSEVEVVAEKRWRRGNPDDVSIKVTHTGSGGRDVLVCAIWEERTERCDEHGYEMDDNNRNRRGRDDDVAVNFTVRLPEGVRLLASSVNGELDITGASSEVDARTVNGAISARSTGGPVTAETVNGDISVEMTTVGSDDLEFETVNGSITVTVPASLNADVTMRTVNGTLRSDFPMTVQGRINPRRMSARIGNGGPELELSTVNGSIELKRR